MFQSELQAAKSCNSQPGQATIDQPPADSKSAEASSAQAFSVTTDGEPATGSAQQSSDAVDASAERLESLSVDAEEQAEPKPAVPASIQSAALDMLQKQLAGGLPEEALTQVEVALK